MNKSFAFLALCAVVFSVSCSKVIAIQDSNDEVRTFTCVIASDPESRVIISDAGKNTWEPGDQILIHGDYTREGYGFPIITLSESDISADGKSATFSVSGVTPSTHSASKGYKSTIYAGYPASAVKTGEHCYYYTNFQSTNYPLMAAFNVGNTLYFYNLCGVISFKVSGDFDKYEFEGNNQETVGYTYYRSYLVQKSDGSYRLDYNYTSDRGTSGPLTKISGSVTADGSTVNYIGLAAGANLTGGFTIRFYKNGTLVKEAKTNTGVNIARSKLLPLGDITSRLEDANEQPEPYTGSYLCRDEYLGERPAVIAYLTEYTSASSLDATYLTHINYCHGRFVNPTTGDGGISIEQGSNSLMQKVLALKKQKPTLKVLLMIGGWGEKANGFSEMAKSAAKRTEFCQACKSHIDTYGFDGIDIDWEYPGGGPSSNGQSSADPANFNLVLKELRETIGDTKIISVASSSSAGYIDWSGAIKYVDYVNDMTYDMGKPPKHNSPLHKSSTFNQSGNCESSVNSHKNKGIPLNRIVLGVPFYGHGIDPYAEDVKYNQIPAILAATSGTYAGKNIRRWDDVAKVPYLTDESGKIYLGYDDAESVAYKGAFALEKGLFGVMFWEYRHDDSNHTLLKSLYGAVYPE